MGETVESGLLIARARTGVVGSGRRALAEARIPELSALREDVAMRILEVMDAMLMVRCCHVKSRSIWVEVRRRAHRRKSPARRFMVSLGKIRPTRAGREAERIGPERAVWFLTFRSPSKASYRLRGGSVNSDTSR